MDIVIRRAISVVERSSMGAPFKDVSGKSLDGYFCFSFGMLVPLHLA